MVGCHPVVDGHQVVGGGGGDGVSTLQSGGPEMIPVLVVTNKYKCVQ